MFAFENEIPVVTVARSILSAPVPLAGATLSQLTFSDALQFSEPPPAFVTPSVFAAGLEPPWVPLNAPASRLKGITTTKRPSSPAPFWAVMLA